MRRKIPFGLRSIFLMRAFQKLSRSIATALFTAALGETFDWVQSVPSGERPRYSPKPHDVNVTAPPLNTWSGNKGLKPSTKLT